MLTRTHTQRHLHYKMACTSFSSTKSLLAHINMEVCKLLGPSNGTSEISPILFDTLGYFRHLNINFGVKARIKETMVMGSPRIPSWCGAHHDAFGDSECRLHFTQMKHAEWKRTTRESTKAFWNIHDLKEIEDYKGTQRRVTVAPSEAIPLWRFRRLYAVSHPADLRTPRWHCRHSQEQPTNHYKMMVHWHAEPTNAAGGKHALSNVFSVICSKETSEVKWCHFVREMVEIPSLQNAVLDSSQWRYKMTSIISDRSF